MDRYSAEVGTSFTLDNVFTLNDVEADVDSVVRVEILDSSLAIVATITSVTRLSEGHYRVTVPALTRGGTFSDVWYYRPVAAADIEMSANEVVVAAFEGAAGEESPAVSPPAAGASNLCTVTGDFFDAGGAAVQGVLVRFTPSILVEQSLSFGFVSKEVTAESDADGHLSMYLVRGMTGLLSITGVSIVREVTIPDTATASLFSLVAGAPDPFELQELDLVPLPRSS